MAVGEPNFNNSIFNTLFNAVTAHGELKKTYLRFDQNALKSAKITPIATQQSDLRFGRERKMKSVVARSSAEPPFSLQLKLSFKYEVQRAESSDKRGWKS